MSEFVDELAQALSGRLFAGAGGAWKKRRTRQMVQHVGGLALVQAAQIPYLFSLFHQNKERLMHDRLAHDAAARGSGVSPLDRPLRVAWFTDTLGDVNGVSRFIRNMAQQAASRGDEVRIITSTRFETPDLPTVKNFEPLFSMPMPRYEQLEAALPPVMKMLRYIESFRPDVVHVSTPGAVGLVGLLAARQMQAPVIGTYHTDFPAYIDHLFDDHSYTHMCAAYMKWFYGRCGRILSRSAGFVDAMHRVGIRPERIETLRSGIDLADFGPRFRDDTVWEKLGVESTRAARTITALYVGRVSIEKNLPLLARAWERVAATAAREGLRARLVVVGDGPYLGEMRAALESKGAHFLGFRHGRELASLYASADLFVFPSLTDTLGQSVMEAQASGLPAIVSCKGGPCTVVDDGVSGTVVEDEDPSSWSEAMLALLRDADKRTRFAAEARESMRGRDIGESYDHFWRICHELRRAHIIGAEPARAPEIEPSAAVAARHHAA